MPEFTLPDECVRVRHELVALARNELSPISAESVREHLASCADCREEAFEFDLAARSLQKLPQAEPPKDLANRAMKRILAAYGWGGESSEPVALPAPKPEGGFLRRPVNAAIAYAAMAAAVAFAGFLYHVEPLGDAASHLQRRVLGNRVYRTIERVADSMMDRIDPEPGEVAARR